MRGSGPSDAMSSSLIPEVMNCAKPAVAVGDADRRIRRAGELARRVDELLQDGLDGMLRGDRQDGVQSASAESIR